MATEKKPEVKPAWLTGRAQIGQHTGWSKRTVSRMLHDGIIPHKRLGHKLVMVRIADLDAALAKV